MMRKRFFEKEAAELNASVRADIKSFHYSLL
jgi:hypothetical protein